MVQFAETFAVSVHESLPQSDYIPQVDTELLMTQFDQHSVGKIIGKMIITALKIETSNTEEIELDSLKHCTPTDQNRIMIKTELNNQEASE